MSTTDRQNRLLVAEDWKRIYQSFRNADFLSYDFDNLRRTMITYLRTNYPEDFNDYIESSEYIALVDLIAYLGQAFSFRTDLNARENFLETAERRESVLRLARLLSYHAKRNQALNGLLKLQSVATTENILDSSGLNLSGVNVTWNDLTNTNSDEQITKILNAALPVNVGIGNPIAKDTIGGVYTEQYRFNSNNDGLALFPFTRNVNGVNTKFEVVSTKIENSAVTEEDPYPGNKFSIIYKDDGKGKASDNSGYFVHFRQGQLVDGTFNLTNPTTNQVVAIDEININETDVWLYSLDENNIENELWTKVSATEGNNVIYNSLEKGEKNIYSILTRIEDRISLVFGDGVFGNLPQGSFKIYYRISESATTLVQPNALGTVVVSLPYLSHTNTAETLTLTFKLQNTIENGAVSETNENIKNNAPSNYYTQNRMITAEDYQIAPLVRNQEVVKVKSVNRVSSGISRYFDLIDSTGKYSKTNLFGADGIIYKQDYTKKTNFTFATKTDIEGAVQNTIIPILRDYNLRNFYYNEYPVTTVAGNNYMWSSVTNVTNQNTGYVQDTSGENVTLGSYSDSSLSLLVPNSLVKFVAPAGYHFMPDNTLMAGAADHSGSKSYIWSKIISVANDGTDATATGEGAVKLTDKIPSTAKLDRVITKLATNISTDLETQIIDQCFAKNTFGLRYDQTSQSWKLITLDNLNTVSNFSLSRAGNTSSEQADSSWLLLFEADGNKYTITYRASKFVFESPNEIRFFFDSTDKVFENVSGKVVKDKISVLSINTQPDSLSPFTVDYDWEIIANVRDSDGYVDSSKIEITFFDKDEDAVVDDPELFDIIVAEDTNASDKLVFRKKQVNIDGTETYVYYDNTDNTIRVFDKKADLQVTSVYDDGQVFYFIQENLFQVLNKASGNLITTADYAGNKGRDNLKFHYVHAADKDRRLDPSVSNIIDVYMLTANYDTQFRLYLQDQVTFPKPPSSDQLYINYSSELNKIKSISDEIIYHPVKYKILFGSKADSNLQATFKIVKNPEAVINDNDLKTEVLSAINRFFALENWDFGDTFYFSELSAYILQELSPNLVTFVVVPNNETDVFGSLFEVKAESDEIFISGARVNDIAIIDAVTASKLKASGSITTSTTSVNAGVQSSALSTTGTTYTSSTNTTSSSTSSSSSSSSGGGSSY